MTTTLIRRAGVLALIAATTTTLTGCAGVLGATMTYNDTEQAKITEIVLTGDSGDVQITSAAVNATTIKRIVRRSSNPEESYKIVGTTLNIDTSCGHNCSVSYEIQTPPGVGVRGEVHSGDLGLTGMGTTDVRVSSGDIMIKEATGPVAAQATSGDIDVTGATGTVTVKATSGDVRAMNVTGPVDAQVTSGDLTVKLATPNSVTATASSGNVDVIVPSGAYRINADTGSGDESVNGLTNNPAAKYLIDVRTGSGDATVSATA
jgi:hypothetical protein